MKSGLFVVLISPAFFASALRLHNPNLSLQLDSEIDRMLKGTTAIMVEPRCMASMALSVWNVRKELPRIKIQLFVSKVNEPAAKEWFGDDSMIQLLRLPGKLYEEGIPNMRKYNTLLTSIDFWNMVDGDNALTFQADSWVCGNAETTLSGFLKNYSCAYVGAPWNHHVRGCNGVGNGGFSLRNVTAMREVTARKGPAEIAEDVWFCQHLDRSQVCAASSAVHFSKEERNSHEDVVGAHRPWAFSWFKRADRFRKFCPGLSLAEREYRSAKDPDCANAITKGKKLMMEAVELSKGQANFIERQTTSDRDVPFVFTLGEDSFDQKD